MERHMGDEQAQTFRAHLDAVQHIREEEAKRMRAEEALAAEEDEARIAATQSPEEDTSEQSREEYQPYPDMGIADIRRDFRTLRNAGLGLSSLFLLASLGIYGALHIHDSNSPTTKPKPTPTMTPGQIWSAEAYRKLIQAEHNPDTGELYTRLQIVSGKPEDPKIKNVRVRTGPSTANETVGSIPVGIDIDTPTVAVVGKDPEDSEQSAPWYAFECSDVWPMLIPARTDQPEPHQICTISDEVAIPHKNTP
jgi:hypothetical protein